MTVCPISGCGRAADEHRHCTRLGCWTAPTKRLDVDGMRRPWFGCDEHWPDMADALHYGFASNLGTNVHPIGSSA